MVHKLAYNMRELSKASGLGRSLIYEDIKSGRLRTFKVRKRRLANAEDARAWLKSYQEESDGKTP